MKYFFFFLMTLGFGCEFESREPSSIPSKKEKFQFPEEKAHQNPYEEEESELVG